MNEEINFCLDLAREQMQESLNHLEISLSKIRAGKASPQMMSWSVSRISQWTHFEQAFEAMKEDRWVCDQGIKWKASSHIEVSKLHQKRDPMHCWTKVSVSSVHQRNTQGSQINFQFSWKWFTMFRWINFQVKVVCFVLCCPLSCHPVPATSCDFKHSVAWWPASLPRISNGAGVTTAPSSLSCGSTGSSDSQKLNRLKQNLPAWMEATEGKPTSPGVCPLENRSFSGFQWWQSRQCPSTTTFTPARRSIENDSQCVSSATHSWTAMMESVHQPVHPTFQSQWLSSLALLTILVRAVFFNHVKSVNLELAQVENQCRCDLNWNQKQFVSAEQPEVECTFWFTGQPTAEGRTEQLEMAAKIDLWSWVQGPISVSTKGFDCKRAVFCRQATTIANPEATELWTTKCRMILCGAECPSLSTKCCHIRELGVPADLITHHSDKGKLQKPWLAATRTNLWETQATGSNFSLGTGQMPTVSSGASTGSCDHWRRSIPVFNTKSLSWRSSCPQTFELHKWTTQQGLLTIDFSDIGSANGQRPESSCVSFWQSVAEESLETSRIINHDSCQKDCWPKHGRHDTSVWWNFWSQGQKRWSHPWCHNNGQCWQCERFVGHRNPRSWPWPTLTMWKICWPWKPKVMKSWNAVPKMTKEKLFWCLYFFKVYPTEDVSASKMNCDRGIFRKWVWIYVQEIAFLAPFYVSFCLKKGLLLPFSCFSLLSFRFQIKLENRYRGDIKNDCLLSVDTTDCRIREPHPFEQGWSERWSSHKFGKKAGLRYEVALGIRSGDICWVNGPFPCGMFNDWAIFNRLGLRSYLEEDERVEADNGYSAGDPEVCKTPKGCFHPKKNKYMRNRLMARQESVNSRIKSFGILRESYRHKLEDHGDVFRAILVIIQIGIEIIGI